MRINLNTLSILLVLSVCICVDGQRRFSRRAYIEAGTGVNLSYFDVGGGSPGVSFKGSALYDLSPNWRLGASIGVHRARGTDEGTPEAARGYEFRSNLNEISAKAVYLFRFKPYPIRKWKLKLEPRAFVSLGILQFQPKPNDMLATQGNGDYLPVAPFMTGGIGLAYHLDQDLSILFESCGNGSTSDYLEGFTDQSESMVPDLFLTFLVKFIYKIPKVWQ